MATLTQPASRSRIEAEPSAEGRRAFADSLIVTIGGQVQRIFGIFTALALRWWLDPARLGVFTGLRLALDNTNRSSLGVGQGAVQEITILRAQGRETEARHIANVAHSMNHLTCFLYAIGLLAWAWIGAGARAGDPLAREWTWGLTAVAVLVLLKRHESFLIALLRAHHQFTITTRAEALEAMLTAPAVGLGLIWAGFWGLLAAIALVLMVKIVYLHRKSTLDLAWAWDLKLALRLMGIGLPILANTAAFGFIIGIDRVLILSLVPDGARAAGLYSVALLGTNWSLDLAGRVVLVLYPFFQAALGRTGDPLAVARQAAKASEYLAAVLAIAGALAFVFGPEAIGWLLPRYSEGLPALRPLLPGMVLLALAWPARQALIATGQPYRLLVATLLGLVIVAFAGALGAWRNGIVGVAWGMSLGFAAVFLLTDATAFFRASGGCLGWLAHLGRLGVGLGGVAVSASLASQVTFGSGSIVQEAFARLLVLSLGFLAVAVAWMRVHALSIRDLSAIFRPVEPSVSGAK